MSTDTDMLRLFVSGITIYEIGARYGVSHQRVHQRIKRANGGTAPVGGARRRRLTRYATVMKMYRAGRSLKEIASIVGLSYSAIEIYVWRTKTGRAI